MTSLILLTKHGKYPDIFLPFFCFDVAVYSWTKPFAAGPRRSFCTLWCRCTEHIVKECGETRWFLKNFLFTVLWYRYFGTIVGYCANLKNFADFLFAIFLPNLIYIVDWWISIMEYDTLLLTVTGKMQCLCSREKGLPFLFGVMNMHELIVK